MTEKEHCQKCHKPRSSSSGGMVTQFIDVCTCNQLLDHLTQTIRICADCGKRVASKSGTLTQWIFGQGKCECDKPMAVDTPLEKLLMPSFIGFHGIDEEIDLDLSVESFPVERYKPIAELGSGASGRVYLSRDRLLGKRVAVKTLLELTAEQLISFQDEAKALAKLDCLGIVKILDFGASISGTPYMVMEYIPGLSIEKYLEIHGVMEESIARSVFSMVANALEYAHSQGVFHRDLKPSNILLYEKDEKIEVCIIDFGVAKVKESSGLVTVFQNKTLAGTPPYMSPDPIRNQAYDSRSEIYCLGCVLYESLSGHPPFSGETALETLALHVNMVPLSLCVVDPSLSHHISDLVDSCLLKDKERRIDSMATFSSRLSQFQTDEDFHPTAPHTKRKLSYLDLLKSPALIFGAVLTLVFIGFLAFANQQFNSKDSVHDKKISQIPNIGMGSIVSEMDRNGSNRLDFLYKRKCIAKTVKKWIPFLSNRERGKPRRDVQVNTVRFSEGKLESGILSKYIKSKNVREIEMSSCVGDFSVLSELREAENISSLSVQLLESDKQEKLFKEISFLKHLSALSIENATGRDCVINEKQLSAVTKLANLRHLNLVNFDFESGSLSVLSHSKSLMSLDLSTYCLKKGELEEIRRIASVQQLWITCPEIDDRQLEILTSIKSLRWLMIKDCEIKSSTFFKELTKVPDLKSLNLRYSKVLTRL